MGLKVSTGRGTRVRHSTGLEWGEMEKAKKKYPPIKHSTGEESPIRHSTGTEMDYRYIKMLRGESSEDEEEESEERRREAGRLSSIPDHAQEDTTYLDLWAQQRRQVALGRFEEVETERNTPPGAGEQTSKRAGKKVSKEQFKAVDLDY
ncbi:MAG: hypothetical protein ACE5JL_19730, partial [Dehalococcoidia bacterium]